MGVARWIAPADDSEEVGGSGSRAFPVSGSMNKRRQEPSNRTRKTNSRLSVLGVSVSIVVSFASSPLSLSPIP